MVPPLFVLGLLSCVQWSLRTSDQVLVSLCASLESVVHVTLVITSSTPAYKWIACNIGSGPRAASSPCSMNEMVSGISGKSVALCLPDLDIEPGLEDQSKISLIQKI